MPVQYYLVEYCFFNIYITNWLKDLGYRTKLVFFFFTQFLNFPIKMIEFFYILNETFQKIYCPSSRKIGKSLT